MIRDKRSYLKFHLELAIKACNKVVTSYKTTTVDKEYAAYIGKCSRDVYLSLDNYSDLELDFIIDNLRKIMKPIKSNSNAI